MPVMPKRLFNIVALISLLILAVLLCGYFSEFGPVIRYSALGGVHPHSVAVEPGVQAGRVAIYVLDFSGSPVRGYPAGLSFQGWHGGLRLPELHRCFWEFDCHTLGARNGSLFLFAFPLWCAIAPFLVAPLLWLRRRRRPSDDRGFAVVVTPA